MPKLIEQILENSNNIKIKSALGDDGSYDSNENFKYLQTKRIMPGIKVRKNSIISTKNNKIRNREVECQTKEISSNGRRKEYVWTEMMAKETVFSSIKRMFGEYVSATRFQNMVKEMMMKVSLFNLFRRMA